MTAIDSTHDVILDPEGARGPAANGRQTGAPTAEGAEDDTAIQRFARLPRDVGWMMVSVGVLGVIVPGLPGAPFLIAGIAVLAPGGPRLFGALGQAPAEGCRARWREADRPVAR